MLDQEVARRFLAPAGERAALWMSDEHFTADGTLIEASARPKGFLPKDGRPDGAGRSFHGQTRSTDTHASHRLQRLSPKSFQSGRHCRTSGTC